MKHLVSILGLALVSGLAAASSVGASIIDEWASVKIPGPPELHDVVLDPKTTVLMVMGFVENSCNATRRPRCLATVPAVSRLLKAARASGAMVVHSVPTGNPAADDIVKDLRALPGELVIPPNGPNKFLPYDLEFHKYENFDLDKAFHDRGIRTVITTGTQVQTAVLHTAAEAALRGYKVVVPVDGMSGDSPYPEQYTAWHLANTQRVMQQVTLTDTSKITFKK